MSINITRIWIVPALLVLIATIYTYFCVLSQFNQKLSAGKLGYFAPSTQGVRRVGATNTSDHHRDTNTKYSRADGRVTGLQGFRGEEKNGSENSPVKTILFWNSWYHRRDYMFGLGKKPFQDASCKVDQCRTTTEKQDFKTSDIVVFFGRLLPYDSFDVVPKRAFPGQLYAFLNTESPVKTKGKTGQLGTTMNISITYRRDSTIPWLFHKTVPRSQREKSDPPANTIVSTKKRLVSWMISHCKKPGNIRMDYARALAQYTEVDIYGACGNLTCGKRDMGMCMEMLESKYMFYLAFENSICTDYITEKAFRTLQYNLVPIVMGGANYSAFLPPHSYIDVADFESPRHLAKYLKHLQGQPKKYLEYFEWKRKFKIFPIPISDVFCHLCEFLHGPTQHLESFDVGRWWEGDHCEYNITKMKEHFHLTT